MAAFDGEPIAAMRRSQCGEVRLRAVELTDVGRAKLNPARSVSAGDHLTLHLTA